MKIYNVLFETNYENECEVVSTICSYKKREDAIKCLEKTLADELVEGGYSDDEVEELLVRDGDDFFCFYHDSAQSNWKFRCTVYETELW